MLSELASRLWTPVRTVPPAETGLLAESRAAEKRARRAEALLQHAEADLRCYGARSVTEDWPDPYGPDVVVFGPYPRAVGP